MFFPTLNAYAALFHFDLLLRRGNFAAVYDAVRRRPCRRHEHEADTIRRVCSAVDSACIWYWKQVLCLQRSAVTTCLLKDSGIPAQLVIGAQHTPFRAHAWVEVDGRVVNDNSYTNEIYAVLDRC
jgi:Transglutaminase-like superfamily